MSDLKLQIFSKFILEILEFQLLYCLLSILSSSFYVSQRLTFVTQTPIVSALFVENTALAVPIACTLLNTDVC